MSTVGALYNCCRYLNGLDKEMLFLEEEKKLLKNVSISECWFVNWSQKTDLSHRSEANESSFDLLRICTSDEVWASLEQD